MAPAPPPRWRRIALAVGVAVGLAVGVAAAAGCAGGGDSAPDPTSPPPSTDAGAGVAGGPVVLFVRGGPGSGGFLEGGADEQLSDVTDRSTTPGNHGWGALADLLVADGFTVRQAVEGAGDTPVRLDAATLAEVAVLVLGSNNAPYDAAAADAVEAFVRAGGGLLVVSDANWGSDWEDAPTSDQVFLDRFDLVVNQDAGTYEIGRDDFVAGAHPVLDGVGRFDGEGVSPFTVVDRIPDVDPTILAPARGDVRRNDGPDGPLTPATERDAALVVADAGAGRVVGHFDRNTFFNAGGAGTSIERVDNRALARALFAWLAGG